MKGIAVICALLYVSIQIIRKIAFRIKLKSIINKSDNKLSCKEKLKEYFSSKGYEVQESADHQLQVFSKKTFSFGLLVMMLILTLWFSVLMIFPTVIYVVYYLFFNKGDFRVYEFSNDKVMLLKSA